jgi:hypothetical protein
MTETGETLADLWQEGSESHARREILKAVQRYVAFNFIRSEPAEPYRLYQRMLAPYPGGMLVELSDDTCVKFPEIEAQESAM